MTSRLYPTWSNLCATTSRVLLFLLLGAGILFCLAVAMELHGCKSNPVEAPLKNPREYTWTVDTISQPNNSISLECIWGSSESDVYAAGYSTLGTGRMWHYDGQSWQKVRLLNLEGGPFSNMGGLFAIIGFAKNDVFAFGYKYGGPTGFLSFVIHFDGYQWTEQNVSDGDFLVSAWGITREDIWACGNIGTLLHYDGRQWSRRAMDLRFSFFSVSGSSSNDVYLLGSRSSLQDQQHDFYVIQRYDGSSWTLLDSVNASSLSPSFGNRALTLVDKVIFTLGYGVYSRQDSGWQVNFRTSVPLYGMSAISLSNVLVVGEHSSIYHFDGSSWPRIQSPLDDGWMLTSVWSTNRQAFITGRNQAGKSVVLHGR